MSKNQISKKVSMKHIFLVINLLFFCALSAGNYVYLTEGGLLLKSICSGMFTAMGLVNLVYVLLCRRHGSRSCPMGYPVVMAVGFMLAMAGDVAIGDNFILGAGLFALGHVMFYVAYCLLQKAAWLDIVCSGVLFMGAAAFLLFCPLLRFPQPVMQWVCLGYALIISLMVGKAISAFIRDPKNPIFLVLALGSALFFFSDLMLVFDWFMDMGSWTGKLCMATYYPAQSLLAFSVWCAGHRAEH